MWIELTEDVIKGSAALAAPELAAARATAAASGDTLSEVLSRVTREVRAYVGGCKTNTLGDGATIPDECLTAAMARVVYELTLRIPGKVLLTDQRDKANDNAMRMLRDAANCVLAIAAPETATTEAVASPTPRITPRHRNFDACDQAGI